MASKNILIVEDDADLAEAIRGVACGLSGVEAEIVSSVAAACEKLKQRAFGVVVSDYSLGEGQPSGLDLWNRLRSSDPKIQFVMITGYSREVFAQVLQTGATCPHHFLTKPFSAAQCRRTLGKALDES